MGNLSGQVAVVTGAARGIGAATAGRLANDGAAVVVVDLDVTACQATVQGIRNVGGNAMAVACDISQPEQVEAAFAEVGEAFGRIDILVNNAGVIRDNLLFRMSESDWDTVMDVHLKGSFLCSQAAQKWMVKQNYGRIVNLSSTSALGNRGQANYSAAKAGLQGFTKTLAMELGPFNVNVNAVAPGFIETEMTKQTAERLGLTVADFGAKVAEQVALRRIGKPADVAGVVSFLCSEDASYVTGQVIYVSGNPH